MKDLPRLTLVLPEATTGAQEATGEDLTGEDLTREDLTGEDLTGEDLTGASERRVLSYKEQAKERRHAQYQSAKAWRATDPRYLAQQAAAKEAAKVQRRAVYEQVKERRKAVAVEAKSKAKLSRVLEHNTRHASRVADKNRELMKLVTWVVKGSSAEND